MNPSTPMRSYPNRRSVRGLSLIELMISLVLGLIVVAGAGAIFISNRQTYTATDSLGRVQENARVAFELMARDVREAAGNPCAKNLPVADVLKNSATAWWANWSDGIVGYDGNVAMAGNAFGTGNKDRVAGTDAIELKSGGTGGTTVVKHNPTSAQFEVNTVNHDLNDSDIALICDFRQAAIFQITNAQPGTNTTVVHNDSKTAVPGNCSKGLGIPTDCVGPNGTPYQYGANSVIVKLSATRWYIGYNDRGGMSLYQSILQNNAGTVQPTSQEIAEGVTNMTLTYLLPNQNNYVDASVVTGSNQWKDVKAVRIEVDLVGQDKVGTDKSVLKRKLSHVATLRNRVL